LVVRDTSFKPFKARWSLYVPPSLTFTNSYVLPTKCI